MGRRFRRRSMLNRVSGKLGGLISAYNIGTAMVDGNWNGVALETATYVIGRTSYGGLMMVGQAFYFIGASQMPEEASKHAADSRVFYNNAMYYQDRGMRFQANYWLNKSMESEKRSQTIVNNFLKQ